MNLPDKTKNKVAFENLTPLFPEERIIMESGNGTTEDLSARIIDLVSPTGKGQRGLIVSPPKAGKTLLMQSIAHSIEKNSPESKLMVLLVDERPEEVTDMKRSVRGKLLQVLSMNLLLDTYKLQKWSLLRPKDSLKKNMTL